MRKAMRIPARRYARVTASDLSGGMNSFTDGRVLPFARGEAAFNVTVASGALKSGYGVAATTVPSARHKVFCYKVFDETDNKAKYYYIAHDAITGNVWGGGGAPDEWREIAGVHFACTPVGTNYRLYGEDVFLLCGEEGMAVIDARLHAVTVAAAPCITSLAMHNERMFVTIGGRKNAVWFSDDLDPTNWNPELDEGGFIELEGESGRLNRAVAFGGYVYVFRDYGISRLSAYGAQSDFSVTNLFVSSGKIFADTVAVCGDRILFLAADGLYSFDGLSTVRIARHLDGLIVPNDGATACYSGGVYWLAAAREKQGDNELLVAIDPRAKVTSVGKGVRVQTFSPLMREEGETLCVCSPAQELLGEVRLGADYYGEPLKKTWRSGFGDLGAPDRRKLITDVFLDTAHDCTVCVRTERSKRTFVFRGKREVQRKRVHLAGTKVQLEITAAGDMDIARPTLRYTVLS